MKLVTASQMQALDKAAIEKFNIPSLELMERAGRGVSSVIIERFPKKGLCCIVVGKGNNGGDGLVVARYLKEAGFDIEIFLTSPWTEFSKDARANWDRLAGLDVKIHEIATEADAKKLHQFLERAGVIVDAMFGTGLGAEVQGRYRLIIDAMNASGKQVVSVDVPSGLSSDTGEVLGVAVRAKLTLTFGMPKVGLFTNVGSEHAREVDVIDIGIPKELTDRLEIGYYLITPDIFSKHFIPRGKDTNKGDFGRVLVVAGSLGKIGAGLLSSRAALRSGAGLVTYALPSSAYAKFDTRAPEVMYEGVADNKLGSFNKHSGAEVTALMMDKDVVAIGPGVGTAGDTKAFVTDIVKKCAAPIVIDADGLNCLADSPGVLAFRKYPTVITPHPGEMARLVGGNIKDIQSDRIRHARELAKKHHIFVVLKGHRTVVATPDGRIYINPTGNPAMATAGTGDVLTGVIAGFIAQQIPTEMSVIAGVYLHGLAGDLAAKEIGERGMIASDLIGYLPKAIKTLQRAT